MRMGIRMGIRRSWRSHVRLLAGSLFRMWWLPAAYGIDVFVFASVWFSRVWVPGTTRTFPPPLRDSPKELQPTAVGDRRQTGIM